MSFDHLQLILWPHTALKHRSDHYEYYYTGRYCVQDRILYLVTPLLPLQIFVFLKILIFFWRNTPFEHIKFWDMGVAGLAFYKDLWWVTHKNVFIDWYTSLWIFGCQSFIKAFHLRIQSFENGWFEQTQFSEVSMMNLKLCLLLQGYIVFNIKKASYWLFYFHYK